MSEESVYTLTALLPSLAENVVIKEVSVPVDANSSGSDLDAMIDLMEGVRSRSASSAANIMTDQVLESLNEGLPPTTRSRAASRAGDGSLPSALPTVFEAMEMPSNAISIQTSEESKDAIELTITVPIISDTSLFTGIADEEEVEQSRSRSASVAPPANYLSNMRAPLDESKKYYLYISGNFTSNNAPGLCDGMERIWFCGDYPSTVPDNYVYVLHPSVKDLPITEKFRVRCSCDVEAMIDIIVSSAHWVATIKTIVERQGELWLKGYATYAGFSKIMAIDPRIKVFGLEPTLSVSLNNKVHQLELLGKDVPLPKLATIPISQCVERFDEIASSEGCFLALETGSAGSGTFHIKTKEDMASFASVLSDQSVPVNMAEWLTLTASVSIDMLIASPTEVIVYGTIDQVYDSMRGLQCMGSNYPADLTPEHLQKVLDLSHTIGRLLAEKTGVRGYISIDLSRDGLTENWYFTEVNARYPGSVSERMCMMEACRPKGTPNMLELELAAIRDGSFNGLTLWPEPKDVCWARRRVLTEAEFELSENAIVDIRRNIQASGTIDFFEEEDEHKLFLQEKGVALIGFLEGGSLCKQGACLGKIVVVAPTASERNALLQDAEAALEGVLPLISYG
jgi:hypothetical protein